MEKSRSYDSEIPDAGEFAFLRKEWRRSLAGDVTLRRQAIDLTMAGNRYNYGYQWEWCGVPIIRLPDDIVLQQEIMWLLKPRCVIETGIARGGSLVLSSSMMQLYSGKSSVLGIDIQILDHAKESLKPWLEDGRIEIYESDSTSDKAVNIASQLVSNHPGPALLVLDSNHSHEHVLKELSLFTPLLPVGSIVIVADTIISEMPDDYYSDRPWNKARNPFSAVREFLASQSNYVEDTRWSRRSLMGECRDGILIRIS